MIVVTVARRPLTAGSVAANVLKNEAGALCVDACRISVPGGGGSPAAKRRETARRTGNAPLTGKTAAEANEEGRILRRGSADVYLTERASEQLGRWPANLILSHLEGCREVGSKTVRNKATPYVRSVPTTAQIGATGFKPAGTAPRTYAGEDGMETVVAWDCVPGCPVADLDMQSGTVKGAVSNGKKAGTGFHGDFGNQEQVPSYDDTGGASRYFKQIGGSR